MALHEIYTAQDLKDFRDLVNAGNYSESAILMNDIDLAGNDTDQWVPICIPDAYIGTFDGNNYIISGIYINKTTDENDIGFICRLGNTGVVKNLTVDGSINLGANSAGIAGIVGFALTGPDIENCINKINITIAGNNSNHYAAGILGNMSVGRNIINCINEGNIINGSGIAGFTNQCTISNCINKGNITNGNGIIDMLASVSLDEHGVYNCINKGNITNGNGIGHSMFCTVKNCINEGNIINGSGIAYDSADIINCVNKGSITNGNGIVYQGRGNIYNTINKGNITITTALSNVAGIITYMIDFDKQIINCVNMGNITVTIDANINIGGITASIGVTVSNISNCVNMGNITCNINNNPIGGISGETNSTGTWTIKNCVNNGIITSGGIQTNKGGITGDIHKYIINDTLIDISLNYINNYYLNTSCDKAIGTSTAPTSMLKVITRDNTFFIYSKGNAPAVACLIDNILIESEIIKPKIYPYYNNLISTVIFSDWIVSDITIASIVDDSINFNKNGNIIVDYNVEFFCNYNNVNLGEISIEDKYLYITNLITSYKQIKYMKHYNNYLFCLYDNIIIPKN